MSETKKVSRLVKVAVNTVVLLAGLRVHGQQMPEHGHQVTKPSTNLSVNVAGVATSMTVEQLRAMPQQTITVTNSHTKKIENYVGARLSDVLVKAGAKLGKETLHGYVKAKGADGYWVLYSGEEIDGSVHTGEVIVATELDGKAIGADGAMKLVSTEDKKPERWVRNLSQLSWKTAE